MAKGPLLEPYLTNDRWSDSVYFSPVPMDKKERMGAWATSNVLRPCTEQHVADAAFSQCSGEVLHASSHDKKYIAVGCKDPRGMAAVLDATDCKYVGHVSTDAIQLQGVKAKDLHGITSK
jgi:hypothetical protein